MIYLLQEGTSLTQGRFGLLAGDLWDTCNETAASS